MSGMTITIRPWCDGDQASCEEILRALPDWFGIEESLVEYVADTRRYPTWLAMAADRAVGFITLHDHFPCAAEIHCLAVRPELHRGGIGRELIRHIERVCMARGVTLLQVKTQGPSRPCEFYDKTRLFYLATGFKPLEELIGFWGRNPCLILVKHLPPVEPHP